MYANLVFLLLTPGFLLAIPEIRAALAKNLVITTLLILINFLLFTTIHRALRRHGEGFEEEPYEEEPYEDEPYEEEPYEEEGFSCGGYPSLEMGPPQKRR